MSFKTTPIGIFDSHAHYDDERYDADRDELLGALFSGASGAGSADGIADGMADGMAVDYIINIGSDLDSSARAVALAARNERIFAAVGIHPHEAKEAPGDYLERLTELLESDKVVALGEIGLDFHYDFSPRSVQREVFLRQLELAHTLGKRVIIHDRESERECLRTVLGFPELRGVFHCFSGTKQDALTLQESGWYISFAGNITYKKTEQLREAAAAVAEDKLLIETDCPYLPPVPHRGKRNHSGYIFHTACLLAELRGTSVQHIIEVTNRNAREFFGI